MDLDEQHTRSTPPALPAQPPEYRIDRSSPWAPPEYHGRHRAPLTSAFWKGNR